MHLDKLFATAIRRLTFLCIISRGAFLKVNIQSLYGSYAALTTLASVQTPCHPAGYSFTDTGQMKSTRPCPTPAVCWCGILIRYVLNN